jgi:O-antigen ligase
VASVVSAASFQGGLAAPLSFLAVAFACLAARFGFVTPYAIAALALVLLAWTRPAQAFAFTPLSASVIAFATCIFASTLFFSPAYAPVGVFQALVLVAAYAAARRLVDQELRDAAFAVFSLAAAASIWGLLQVGAFGLPRAQASFETPATLAAFLNLSLVFLLGLVIAGRSTRAVWAFALLLTSGLFAADSRGGLLAAGAGLVTAAVLASRAGRLRWRSVGLAIALVAVGWMAAVTLRAASPSGQVAPSAQARAESTASRIELYALSWHAWQAQPIAGTGHLTFRYVLEGNRARVPSYAEANDTWFVHNDYLQALQELGVLGLAALLALVALPLAIAYRRLPALHTDRQPLVIAAASSCGAMACHALFDYPFYVPACLLVFGALVGLLDREFAARGQPRSARTLSTRWGRAAVAGASVLACAVFLRPVLAEAAAEWGLHNAKVGRPQSAALWLGAAQRIEPADWRYHWYAGQFWDLQFASTGRREAAQFAARAYESGFAANSLEVRNLLGMISVHRRHRDQLPVPADETTLNAWRARATLLAPLSPDVRRELSK